MTTFETRIMDGSNAATAGHCEDRLGQPYAVVEKQFLTFLEGEQGEPG